MEFADFYEYRSAEEGRNDKSTQQLKEVHEEMIFITLGRFKAKPTKDSVAESSKLMEKLVKEGGKILGMYWTLGRYDAVLIMEAKDEKAAMKALLRWGDIVSTETLVAVTREEATKLIE